MAGYFSNHSQSRFLANSGSNSTTTATTTTAATTSTATLPPPDAAPAIRARVPSKHFSTTISDERVHAKEKTPSNGPTNGGVIGVHPLRNTWVYWFRQQRAPGNKITNYEEGIKKISAFSSVESFWSLWTHLHPPSALLPTTDYLLFHSGVRRPVWEDPLNLSGGKWIIRLKKGVADRLWEDLVLGIIGDQFDDCRADESVGGEVEDGGEWPEICGCTISVRQSEDIVSVWNRVDGDVKVREKIRDAIRRVLNLPRLSPPWTKSTPDSMQDKSSFRNSAIDRTPLS